MQPAIQLRSKLYSYISERHIMIISYIAIQLVHKSKPICSSILTVQLLHNAWNFTLIIATLIVGQLPHNWLYKLAIAISNYTYRYFIMGDTILTHALYTYTWLLAIYSQLFELPIASSNSQLSLAIAIPIYFMRPHTINNKRAIDASYLLWLAIAASYRFSI